MFAKQPLVSLDQPCLTNGGDRLQLSDVRRPTLPAELPDPSPNGPGTDEYDSFSGLVERVDFVGQLSDSRLVQATVLTGDHTCPHLDNESLGRIDDLPTHERRLCQ